ncbi:1-acyl-sn-glycerol-3-phosphate acyltransferase [Pandoraea nosoerga]|uniref:Acyl-phosphate glycerol 3-phosphate acyltransferase n=1 Tax=Pandoraea nosoerga TaxID=2508296 RepID=A0A5E4TC26_9BURK|nr:lysophospholipid acyltransferase family protein [Pandoraea nosoerga]MBN4664169.1 1-acyl-sn-glycerol-3-phosphate acyltransferase [Pandoraea nosoerga]MBN4675422.1 1-acyl-sn-glycerol-3-phosphate acyltransferase [Pandoraea nosoerga]MBN4679256.1 1-acyl-sn-glycerol-3-phosphate acyltransferase [Pandoraea nosoerga]MBN4743746.1 1-acyl-sn-glycerol-3-phosphate acyltransferase [Pandoraea nosoerga]VVD85011.1 acyl-phosphate glycerol 3-phosphate acyltransferase [Pandoraea nosoerga]
MLRLRSILFFIFLIVWTVPYAIACIVSFPFLSRVQRYWFAVGWCRVVLRVAEALCGIRYRVIGRENLPDTPAIILSKHQSAWETIALPALMSRPLCYVFKRELLYVPFFGWALGLLSMIHIDRSKGTDAFQSVVQQGRLRLAEGAWIIMFPEGTRTKTGSRNKYKSGGARLAATTGTPVVPVAHNAGRVWPRNSFMKYPGEVIVSIGPVIQTEGRTAEAVNAEVAEWIEREMVRIDPAAYTSKPRTHAADATDTSDATPRT